MSAPPYIPFFVEDYIGDTIELSLDEHGAYFLLMMAAWKQDTCDLPDDDRKLARICRVSPQKWKRLRSVMLDFWTIESGRWCNPRLKKERVYVEKKSQLARDKANKRWDEQAPEKPKNGECSGNAGADAEGGAGADAPYTPHNIEPNGSMPTGDAGSPPIDIVKAIFDSGIFILQRGGKNDRQARSLIGGWRKQYHDSVVLTVLAEAQARSPSEPVAWIVEHLRVEANKAAGTRNGNQQSHRNSGPVDHDQEAWRRRIEAGRAEEPSGATG